MKTILLVDDDQNIQELLSTLIASHTDYKTVSAEDGEAALDILEDVTPALVIMDILMPRVGGIALYYDIRRLKKMENTPVIFMSGMMKDEEFIKEGLEMGAVDYITKPIDLPALLDKINRLLAGD